MKIGIIKTIDQSIIIPPSHVKNVCRGSLTCKYLGGFIENGDMKFFCAKNIALRKKIDNTIFTAKGNNCDGFTPLK